MDTSKVYFDSEGNECSIWRMVKREPTWAAVRIQEGEKAIDEITTLRQQLANSETRVTDAIRCLETVSGKAELGASVVRAERTEVMDHVAEGFDVIKKYAKSEAARLRQQADEAERAGGEK